MKKLSALVATTLIAGSLFSSSAFAANLNMKVNGKPIEFQYGTPFIEDGSSLIPLRDLLVSLGVPNDDQHIIWDGNAQSVTVIKGDTTVKLSVGQKEIYKNGQVFKTLEVPAKNVDGRVFLPARAVAEALGNQVGYDSETSTVVIDSIKTTNSNTVSFDLSSLKDLVAQSTNNDVQLTDASYQVLLDNKELFFGNNREIRSLREKASEISENAIAKNVSSYQERIITTNSIKIDEIHERTLEDGSIITNAIGHTGGTLSPITRTYIEETYFQIIFVGKTSVVKGDYAYFYGLPVGETSVALTNPLGITTQQPMYVIVAGNFLTQMEYINDQKPSENFELKEKFPTKEEMMLKKLDISLEGFTLQTFNQEDLQITKIEIGNYSYELSETESTKGLFRLALLKDKDGNPFSPKSGVSYKVAITTNAGEVTKEAEYREAGRNYVANILKVKSELKEDKLQLQYPNGIDFSIKAIKIKSAYNGEFTYQPSQPINIKPSDNVIDLPYSSFKNKVGSTYELKKLGASSVIIETDLGQLSLPQLALPVEEPYKAGQPNQRDQLKTPATPIEGN